MRLEETAEILAIFILECPDHGKENSASGPVSLVEEKLAKIKDGNNGVQVMLGARWACTIFCPGSQIMTK